MNLLISLFHSKDDMMIFQEKCVHIFTTTHILINKYKLKVHTALYTVLTCQVGKTE